MVRKIEAYQDSKGNLWEFEEQAKRSEIIIDLHKLLDNDYEDGGIDVATIFKYRREITAILMRDVPE